MEIYGTWKSQAILAGLRFGTCDFVEALRKFANLFDLSGFVF